MKTGSGRRDPGENCDVATPSPIAQEPDVAPSYLVMKDKSAWHLFLLPTAPRSTVHLPERVPWRVQRHTRWPVCYYHIPEIPSKVSDKAVLPAWTDQPTALPPCYSPLPEAVLYLNTRSCKALPWVLPRPLSIL